MRPSLFLVRQNPAPVCRKGERIRFLLTVLAKICRDHLVNMKYLFLPLRNDEPRVLLLPLEKYQARKRSQAVGIVWQ